MNEDPILESWLEARRQTPVRPGFADDVMRALGAPAPGRVSRPEPWPVRTLLNAVRWSFGFAVLALSMGLGRVALVLLITLLTPSQGLSA